jgi:hypothetical protein
MSWSLSGEDLKVATACFKALNMLSSENRNKNLIQDSQ